MRLLRANCYGSVYIETVRKKTSDWQHFRFVSFACSSCVCWSIFHVFEPIESVHNFFLSWQIIFYFVYFFFIHLFAKYVFQFKNLLTYLFGLIYSSVEFVVRLQTRAKNFNGFDLKSTVISRAIVSSTLKGCCTRRKWSWSQQRSEHWWTTALSRVNQSTDDLKCPYRTLLDFLSMHKVMVRHRHSITHDNHQ